jgi:hypothetical protein
MQPRDRRRVPLHAPKWRGAQAHRPTIMLDAHASPSILTQDTAYLESLEAKARGMMLNPLPSAHNRNDPQQFHYSDASKPRIRGHLYRTENFAC